MGFTREYLRDTNSCVDADLRQVCQCVRLWHICFGISWCKQFRKLKVGIKKLPECKRFRQRLNKGG